MGRSPVSAGTPAQMHARSDDHDVQPTPKKLKSEKAVRRPALRDVTNAQRAETVEPDGAAPADAAKPNRLQPAASVSKPPGGAVVSPREDATAAVVVSVAAEHVPKTQTPDFVENGEEENNVVVEEEHGVVVSKVQSLEDFEYLMGQEEEEELAAIMYIRLREKQLHNRVTSNYLDDQPEVNAKMRSILIDWLIELHYRFKLENETLFLAINYLDRYLSLEATTRDQLQLVGLACLFIAAKFEEVEPVELSDLTYACSNTYTADDIIQMERKILGDLGFNLVAATAQGFLDHFAHKLQVDQVVSLLAAFFTQSTLLHLPLLICYAPAERAAVAVYLAHCVAAEDRPSDDWVARWEETVGHSFADLHPCLEDLCTVMTNQSKKLAALRTKFGTKKFGRVAHKPVDKLDSFL